MVPLKFTLLSDGSSDRALLPVLSWVLRTVGEVALPQGEWADLAVVRGGVATLAERIQWAVELFPCDVLFVHRDAEKQDSGLRRAEIDEALRSRSAEVQAVPCIRIIPVRMQEAWLLFNERAIRIAAGNPNGVQPLSLPRINELESLTDPKALLHGALERASGLAGRRLKKFEARRRCFDVAENAADGGFAPLEQLSAFRQLLEDVAELKAAGRTLR